MGRNATLKVLKVMTAKNMLPLDADDSTAVFIGGKHFQEKLYL